jgi:Senescence-associated protein
MKRISRGFVFQIPRRKSGHSIRSTKSDGDMRFNPTADSWDNSDRCPEGSCVGNENQEIGPIITKDDSIGASIDHVTKRKRANETPHKQECESESGVWYSFNEPELERIMHPILRRMSSNTTLSHSPLNIMAILRKMYRGGVPGSVIHSLAIVLSRLLSTTTTSGSSDDNLQSDIDNLSNKIDRSFATCLPSNDENTVDTDEEFYISSIQHLGRFLMVGSSYHEHMDHDVIDSELETSRVDVEKQKLLTIYGLLASTASNPIFHEMPLLDDFDIPSQVIHHIETVFNFCIDNPSTAISAASITCNNKEIFKESDGCHLRQNQWDDFIPGTDFVDRNSTSCNLHHQKRCIQNEKLLFVLWEIRSVCRNFQMHDTRGDKNIVCHRDPTAQRCSNSSEYIDESNEHFSFGPKELSATRFVSSSEEMTTVPTTSIFESVNNADCVTMTKAYPSEQMRSSIIHKESTAWKLQSILKKFRDLYGVVDFQVLVSIAYIARAVRAYERNRQTMAHHHEYNESLLIVAEFLCDRKQPVRIRLACLQIFFLSSDNQQEPASNTNSNGIITHGSFTLEDALLFCTNRRPRDRQERDWEEYLQENDTILPLLWEIRAICINMRLQERIEKRKSSFFMPGVIACTKAADIVTSGTVTIERSINTTTNLITSSIDAAGDYIVRSTNPSSVAILDAESTITQLALCCTSSARRASDQTRSVTFSAISGIKEASRTGVRVVVSKMNLTSNSEDEVQLASANGFDDGDVKDDVDDCIDGPQTSIVTSAGQLGLVTIGAMVIVGDAIGDSAIKVIQHTSHTAADIVAHKFGPSAGQVIRDVADTTGNVLDTMKHVAFLVAPIFGHGQGVARMVVKDTSKTHINNSLYVDSINSPTSEQSDLSFSEKSPIPANDSQPVSKCDHIVTHKGTIGEEEHFGATIKQKQVLESKESPSVSDDETLADSVCGDDPEMIIEVKAIGCI